jgi:hypothetical protein
MKYRSWSTAAAAASLLATTLAVVTPSLSFAGTPAMPDAAVAGCDALVTTPVNHSCLLPWPNDAFTIPAKTNTGRQIHISATSTPANKSGVHINPTYQNRNDGFSPGSVIMINVPNLSTSATGIAPSTNIGQSLPSSDTSPIVLLDTVTHQHVPYFAELDGQNTDASTQLLLIHPAINFLETHRIVVVLRNLKDANNAAIAQLPGETTALKAAKPTTRQAHLKWIVQNDLKGLNTSSLYAAWDFTVISGAGSSTSKFTQGSLADAGLTMRDQAFKSVGTKAPVFRVTNVSDNTLVHEVDGSFLVPTFLKACPTTQTAEYQSTNTSNCSSMNLDKNGLPLLVPDATRQIWANFICVMPETLSSTQGAALPTLYGHGLLGSAHEVAGGSFAHGVQDNMMGCATDWSGMSGSDLLLVAASLGDMSYFHVLTDHMLQGFVNFQFLGRLINSAQGFAKDPAFQQSGAARFLVGKCGYMGYSQGGIMGGALSALSTQWSKVILGVPGLNYGGLLLNRSTDWLEFASVYNPAYPNSTDQQVGLQLAQLLWDRGENDGYTQHITANPYEGTKVKQVFLIENYGDHQVTNASAEVLARSIGAVDHKPVFNPVFTDLTNPSHPVVGTARSNVPVVMHWGITAADQTKVNKATLVLWDYGTPTPPTDNRAPVNTSIYGNDPHGYGRRTDALLSQVTTFMKTGLVPDLCNAAACQGIPGS